MQHARRLFEYFQPEHYDLALDLQREARTFSGVVVITGVKTADNEPIVLHAKDLRVTSVVLDDASVPFHIAGDELTIEASSIPAGKYRLTIQFDGTITDPMHGLYPCYYEIDGVKKELLATQFESHHAREVFPCIDEPAAKATYDLTLMTETGVEVISNMPHVEQSVDENRLMTKFETTPRMSTYLLAFVVGDMQKTTTKTQDGVEINVYATKAQNAKSLVYAADWARRSIEFFEDYFGVKYPLAKSDHVALPDFSVSAMENWGLVTYREAALLVDSETATTETKQFISMVISHELAHQWFGNLVTMQWWDDLWLNESFANLMGYAACDALEPDWHSWDEFSATECFSALKRDALDGVQPVKVTVDDPDEINAIFDHAIVYAKGSRLLKMLHDYIGTPAFQAGLKTYFETFAYQNTTGDDLWSELQKASGVDVGAFMKNWLTLPGYPIVTLGSASISQRRFFIGEHGADNTLWQIPLLANDALFPKMLTSASQLINNTSSLLLNMSDGAHFITRYDDNQVQNIIDSVKRGKLSTNDTLRLINEWQLLALSGETTCEMLVQLLSSLTEQTDPNIWQAALNAFSSLRLVTEHDPDLKTRLHNFAAALSAKQYSRLGWRPVEGESASDTRVRPYILGLASFSETHDVKTSVRAMYESADFAELPASTRATIGRAMIRSGIGDAEFDELFEQYRTAQLPELRADLMSALTATTAERQIANIITALTDGTIRPQDTRRWMIHLLGSTTTRAKTWQWIRDEWSWIERMFRNDITFDAFPTLAGRFLVSEAQLGEYRAFFMPLKNIQALTRAISLGEKELGATVEFIANNKAVLSQTLTNLKEPL